jgi:hypothetical protein
MNLSTELLIGIILIGIGLLLGAAAYIVLSSRKDEQLEEDEAQDDNLDDELDDELEEDLPAMADVDEIEIDEDIITEPEMSEEAEPEELPIPDHPDTIRTKSLKLKISISMQRRMKERIRMQYLNPNLLNQSHSHQNRSLVRELK